MHSRKLSFFHKTLFLTLFSITSSLSAMQMQQYDSNRLTSQTIMGEFCLLNAAIRNDEHEVNLWIQHGVNINTTDALYNFTPLHFAVGHGNTKIGKILLDKNALINAQDIDGDTPLHIAVENEDIPFIELLLERGASQKIRNNEKNNAMDLVLIKMYTTTKRKRLSKIHQELLIAHMNKVCKEHH